MTITPAHADRIAENRQLRAEMAHAAHLIETGRTLEALTLLRGAGHRNDPYAVGRIVAVVEQTPEEPQ
ncbi:hypothetical protein ACFC1T_14665 [Kitasatospora sp. NPDC056076]|uniref:hypothetical protein n=1 Tax=Kitasatospora sp. NPDC056076 TaxID=3345703 RepID=UPI0035E12103